MPITKSRRGSLARREARTGWLWVQAWLVGFLLFMLVPIVMAIYLSFTEWTGRGAPRWIGLENYQRLLTNDPIFWQSLKVTAVYALMYVPLSIVIGFTIAVVMNQKLRGMSIFRTIYFLPSVLSGVAVAMVFQFVFSTDFGIANQLLHALGIPKIGWLTDSQYVLPALVIMQLWGVGGSIIIYLGGLQGIPTELYEQARVDGAGFWYTLRHITIPMMSPVIFLQLVLTVIGTFQVFTQAYVMTGGGPNYASYFYSLNIFTSAFQGSKFGYASALAVVLFLIILAITALIFRTARSWVFYSGARDAR